MDAASRKEKILQFADADLAVRRAQKAIEAAVRRLLDETAPLEHVPLGYVIVDLVDRLIADNSEALDYLNKQTDKPIVKLTNVIMDWRDEGAS